MAIKIDAKTDVQKECLHKDIRLVDVQVVDVFSSNDYECADCGAAIQTDGKDKLDKDKKADVDKKVKEKKEKGTLGKKDPVEEDKGKESK